VEQKQGIRPVAPTKAKKKKKVVPVKRKSASPPMSLRVRIHNLWSKTTTTTITSGKNKKKDTPSPTTQTATSTDMMASQMSALSLSPGASPPEPRSLLPPQTPEDRGRLCVILDMDETLLHSRFTSVDNDFRQEELREAVTGPHDFSLTFNLSEGAAAERVYVSQRPMLQKFLQSLSKEFEPIVFTAALPVYAAPVLDRIDVKNYIRHRLYRESTVMFKGQNFVKDIAMCGRDIKRIVLIDNNPLAMVATPDNAVPIPSWFDQADDRELEKVLAILKEMKDLEDVRPYLKKKFRFRENLKNIVSFEI
jgi:Dullard-like phosphatase family protein